MCVCVSVFCASMSSSSCASFRGGFCGREGLLGRERGREREREREGERETEALLSEFYDTDVFKCLCGAPPVRTSGFMYAGMRERGFFALSGEKKLLFCGR